MNGRQCDLSTAIHMKLALDEARRAGERGEIPVGSVIIDQHGNVLASDGNRSLELNDPCGHAEILVLRKAGARIGNYRLTDTTLFVTLEPCVMCAGALIHARVRRLVFGAPDPKTGAVITQYRIGSDQRLNHIIEIEGGFMAEESSRLLKEFFSNRRRI